MSNFTVKVISKDIESPLGSYNKERDLIIQGVDDESEAITEALKHPSVDFETKHVLVVS
jgi:hypothetical protein